MSSGSKDSMPANSNWTILVIDDESDIRDVMSVILEDAGYHVVTAPDGESGFMACVEIAPQIVTTDIRMPGISGIQVLEKIKAHDPDIEVIVVTAFGEIEIAVQALQLDASDFITKPIANDALFMALKRARERYTSRRQLKDYLSLLERENARTSQDLQQTLTFRKNLIESSMDGILACDGGGKVVAVNKSFEEMAGFRREELIERKSLMDFLAHGEDERFFKALSGEKYGGANRLFLFETTLSGKDGRSVPVQVSASAMVSDGKPSGLVCFFRDLREIRRLERELEDQTRVLHQDKMMSLGRLSASVVHEINNPLAGVLNYIRLMLRVAERGPVDGEHLEKFKRYLNLAESETERISKIVSSLLTFSRKSTPSFGPVDIGELLNRCCLLSRHKLELSNIALHFNVEPGIAKVEGDANQLQQCIINLIFNAIDAMAHGGDLFISAGRDPSADKVVITVRDTGPGIPKQHLPYIFEPFFTTKKEGYGVGLGLATVFGIMERHKGSVTVESREGQGATFRLLLPPLRF
jgi:PAS domain S-box-containing protein